jgi:type I restriction-modification system DNA methylase subunit
LPETRFENARRIVQELAGRFKLNQSEYESSGYLESQLRTDFIDELFKALNWDLTNKYGLSRLQREVLVEKGDTKGRPDYSFRFNGEDRFFVEAKTPSRGTDKPEDAFQAKRYGWNTRKVNVVVLTDFKSFKVFDTSLKPDLKQPKLGLLFELEFSKFDTIDFEKLWLFSKEAVASGSLDQLSSKDPSAKRLRIPVDAAFLGQMTLWREELAKDVYRRNTTLTARALNDVVQRLLDRLIFIRLLEDRKIIESKTLKEIVDNWKEGRHRDIQAQLNSLFKRLNHDFNGEIFKEHQCEKISYGSEITAEIVDELYYPKSPYDFAVIGVELLGIIYEKYLGKTIRLTEKRVKVEEKPEVRKAGGVYYTPKWVVKYIVENTVGKLTESKTPEEISTLHILDPACGSGSFLIATLEHLFQYHLNYYLTHQQEARRNELFPNFVVAQDEDGNEIPRLSIYKKGEILKNNVYGVDLDPQAVEITMMSLYIKILEGERALPHNKELLPSLSRNVRCGNSLIGFDFLEQKKLVEDSEKEKVNCFDWYSRETGFGSIINKERGFDAIIGNPPYIRIQTMKEWAPKEIEYFSHKYKTAESGNYDIYVVFVEKAIQLLDHNGLFGFILPNKFFQAEYGKTLRYLISKEKLLREIVNFTDQQVFEQATTYTNLLFLSKAQKTVFKYAEIRRLENPENQLSLVRRNAKYSHSSLSVDQLPLTNVTERPWQFGFGKEFELLNRMASIKPVLSEVCDKIFQGIITGADKVFVLELKNSTNAELFELHSKALDKNIKIERELLKPVLKGSLDIRRYKIVTPRRYALFPYLILGSEAKLIPFDELKAKFPNCAHYLESNKKVLEEREHGKWKCSKWYAYSRNQNLVQCSQKKILTPSIAKKAAFVYDELGAYYFLGSGGGGGGGYGLSIDKNLDLDPFYLTGLLNSKLLDYLTKRVSTRFSGGFFAYNKQYIQSLPIVIPSGSLQISRRDQMITFVKRVMSLYQNISTISDLARRELLEREALVYEEKIDDLVYELYGLTEEEKRIVEGFIIH